MRHRRNLTLSSLVLLWTLGGCASTRPLEPRTLPFHVAILPMREPTIGEVSPDELPGESTDMRLALDCVEITDAVSHALHEYCFTGVTVLDHDDLDATADQFERERLLLERARTANADMLVELDLRYDPEIYRKNASTFWLNYPLFLLAGPSNWFVGDNNYHADVELTTTIYDLNVIEAGAFAVGDPAARVLTASSRYTGSLLDFTDRSDGIGDYALGILIPSGHLARESDSSLGKIHAKVIEDLRAQVVQGIQSRRGDLVQAEWIAPVFVEPGDVGLIRDGDDVLVKGRVRLRRNGLVERVHALHLDAGSRRITLEPASSSEEASAGYDVFPFEARVPVSAGATQVRLECEAGTRDRYVRSYTFELPAS